MGYNCHLHESHIKKSHGVTYFNPIFLMLAMVILAGYNSKNCSILLSTTVVVQSQKCVSPSCFAKFAKTAIPTVSSSWRVGADLNWKWRRLNTVVNILLIFVFIIYCDGLKLSWMWYHDGSNNHNLVYKF